MAEETDLAYFRQVFVNCPFDESYWPLFQAVVFTLHACGFAPRCALEANDAGEERLAKILRIIEDCHLGIHDLSRKGADSASGLARFNMPYEMGLFQGAARFGAKKKVMLVMEARPFEYKQLISDISGRDISHHSNEVSKVVPIIREWLHAQRLVEGMPGGLKIVELYSKFQARLPRLLRKVRLHPTEIQFPHFLNWSELVGGWLDGIGWSHRL